MFKKRNLILTLIVLSSFVLFSPLVFAQEASSTDPVVEASEPIVNEEPANNDPSVTEPILGCMDLTANNYNSEATEDDGSCLPAEVPSGTEEGTYPVSEPEETPPPPPPEPEIIYVYVEQPVKPEKQPEPKPAENPVDPAIQPSEVTIAVLMPDGTPPPFPVFVTFVGVGNKNFGGRVNANGQLTVSMPTGRYYTELMVINTQYVQGEDGPSFFLEADDKVDLGGIRLISKSAATRSVEDQAIEADIGEAQGLGKVLALIVKLLMQILEEIRSISSRLS